MSQEFEFGRELTKGEKGEDIFERVFHEPLIRRGGKYFKEDFIIPRTRKTIELKAEYYRLKDTKNYFIERYSNKSTKTEGGPYRSLTDGIDYYIHLFLKDKEWFGFRPKALVDWLETNMDYGDLRDIQNTTHTTQGWVVKREKVEHLLARI